MHPLLIFFFGAGLGIAITRLHRILDDGERITSEHRITRLPGKWSGGES